MQKKIRKNLGWDPKYTFETMLDEMIEYWLSYYGKDIPTLSKTL